MKVQGRMNKVLIAIAAIALSAGVASAQNYDDDDDVMDEQEERMGLTFGVGIGAGHLECGGEYCEGVTEAGGLHAHIGAVMMPFMAVVGDVWMMAHMEDRLMVSQSIATVGPRFWIMPRIWAQVGFGAARASYNYDIEVTELMDSTEWHPAGLAALGFEILGGDDLVLDIQLRAGSGFFNEAETRIYNLSLGVGVNWY